MRLGYETSAWNGLSLQADFDQIWLMAGNYNSSRNGKTSYPVIADPAMTALNRLQPMRQITTLSWRAPAQVAVARGVSVRDCLLPRTDHGRALR